MTRSVARWIPAGTVAAVIAAGSFAMGSAGAAEDLPDKSAAEILALIAEHDVLAFSGAVEQTSDLGIPQVPAEMGPPGAGSSPLELLTASHTARVYVDGPRLRLQILDRLGERDLVVTDEDVWFYDSSENTATRLAFPTEMPIEGFDGQLPEGFLDELPEGFLDELPEGFPDGLPDGHTSDEMPDAVLDALPEGFLDELPEGLLDDLAAWRTDDGGSDPASGGLPFGDGATPVEIAEQLLGALESSTQVTVGADTAVAGRSAYSLLLTPLSAETLVGSISITADAETGMPLSVAVRARGQEAPAWSITFTSLTLGAPDPARFAFTPPPGATIEEPLSDDAPSREEAVPDAAAPEDADTADAEPSDSKPSDTEPSDAETTDADTADSEAAAGHAAGKPTIHGTGWDTVIEMPAGSDGDNPLQDPTLLQLMTEVPGGRALTTSLLNVLVTDNGRVLAGSVTLDRLRAVAAE